MKYLREPLSMCTMSEQPGVEAIEVEIDEAFAASPLLDVGYAQAMWTVLSVNEDHYLKHLRVLGDQEMEIYVDTHLNALTHPLRAVFKRAERAASPLKNQLINRDYALAWKWIEASVQYDQFCTLFPLWHRERIKVEPSAGRLLVTNRHNSDRRYEAYNRFVRKEARKQSKTRGPSDSLLALLTSRMDIEFDSFRVKFNKELVSALITNVEPVMRSRHTLPANWEFVSFALRDFRQVFTVIQAMCAGWHLARSLAADSGMLGMGYRSAVWVTGRAEMVKRLCRFTTVQTDVVERILSLLTFGSNGVREPDIATQPLIDLGNGKLALAPFVWLSTSLERNLCTLLNQLPTERDRYSTLTMGKEKAAFAEAEIFLSRLGLVATSGSVKGTDLDLGIIDHKDKTCLCIEVKWFIEPAEIREIENHTKELAKGIEQAKTLQRLFVGRDKHFLETRLGITPDYQFYCAVGSVNWIGMGDVQDPAVPIVKLWDLLQQIERTTLGQAVEWLRSRRYLPDEGRDFKVLSLDIECGRWKANWYGLEPLERGAFMPAA
jgi:hypothetical protein